MDDTKLIKMLKTFTVSEFAELEKFVESPFFSHGRNLSDFFRCLKPYYPDFANKKFTAENIYLNLYPGKKFDEKTSGNILYKLSSELYKLCKEFLIHNELKSDDSRKHFYLLNKLREKKLYKEFEKEYKNSESSTDNTIQGGVFDFLNKYFLKHSFLEYSIETGDIRNAFDSTLTIGEYSVIIALIKGFRNIDTNQSAVNFNLNVRYNLVDNFIRHLDSEKLLDEMKTNNDKFYPYAAVSHAIHKMFENPDINEYYFNFKKLINEHALLFGRTEKYILFQTMIGYCIKKIDSDYRELFIREEFEAYKTTLELGIFKYDDKDKIQINNFRSIIGSAIDNGEIDWLENFISEYINELDIEYRENMKHYSLAYIYFERNHFEKALECVTKVKYDFFLFKIDVKNLMFKIYFELEYYEQAYSMIDTMKQYISNTKDLSGIFKLREGHFIKYAGELLKAKTSGNKTDVNHYKNVFEKEKHLSSRKWLVEKITELIQ